MQTQPRSGAQFLNRLGLAFFLEGRAAANEEVGHGVKKMSRVEPGIGNARRGSEDTLRRTDNDV